MIPISHECFFVTTWLEMFSHMFFKKSYLPVQDCIMATGLVEMLEIQD